MDAYVLFRLHFATFLTISNPAGTLKETIVGPNTPAIFKALSQILPNNVDGDEPDDNPFAKAKAEEAKAAAKKR